VGCKREADGIRDALGVREASWGRQLAALRAEHVALKSRVGNAPAMAETLAPAQRRVRIACDGVGQSLSDVETQVRQVRPRVEQAVNVGADAAKKTLDEASNQMNGYFEALAADLVAANRELDSLGRNEGAERVQ
jgi:ABC-type transporter Mla subunit MlaD